MYANIISYKDKNFANWEAMKAGRLHCFTENWENASILFLKSGGFIISNKISLINQQTLILWGKNDQILSVNNALKFQKILNKKCELKLINNCGHVPHLEKPQETADFILSFIK